MGTGRKGYREALRNRSSVINKAGLYKGIVAILADGNACMCPVVCAAGPVNGERLLKAECAGAYLGKVPGQVHLLQLSAVLEYTLRQCADALREDDLFQVDAAFKSGGAQHLQIARQRDAFQCDTAAERPLADGSQGVGQGDGGQCTAVGKGIGGKRLHLCLCGNADALQCFAVCKGALVERGQRVRQGDALQGVAAEEGRLADAGQGVRQHHGGKLCAVRKHSVAQPGKAAGDGNGLQLVAAGKDTGGLSALIFRVAVQHRSGQGTAGRESSLANDLQAVWQNKLLECAAGKGVVADVGDGVGQGNAGDIAVVERIAVDAGNRDTIRGLFRDSHRAVGLAADAGHGGRTAGDLVEQFKLAGFRGFTVGGRAGALAGGAGGAAGAGRSGGTGRLRSTGRGRRAIRAAGQQQGGDQQHCHDAAQKFIVFHGTSLLFAAAAAYRVQSGARASSGSSAARSTGSPATGLLSLLRTQVMLPPKS